MYLKTFINDLNFTKRDAIYLTVLLVFSGVLTYHLVNMHYASNIKSDPLVYLINGLIYAGMDEHIISYHSNMFLTPVISFSTSLLFRLGFVDKMAIMIVSGISAIIGLVSLYFLLNVRFDELYSFLGCILFASSNVLLFYWGNGGIDVAVCSFSVLTMFFFILGVNVNPKYYIITAVCLNIAIFTKYIAFFLLPVMLLYYMSRHDFFNLIDIALNDRSEFKRICHSYIKSSEFKYLLISIILASAIFVAMCGVIISNGSGLTFITQSREAVDGFNSENNTLSRAYHNESDYYINYYASLFYYDVLGDEYSPVIPVIILIGFLFSLINIYQNRNKYEFKDYKNSYFKYLIILLIIILPPIAYILFDTSHLLTNICLLIAMAGVYSLSDKIKFNYNYFNLDIMFLAWVLVFSIFLSFINIKDTRYLVIIMPAVIYFLLWSIEQIFGKIKDRNIFKAAVYIFVIILMFYSLTCDFEFQYLADERDNMDLENVYGTLVEWDSNYEMLNLTADYAYGARYGTWLLKKDVKYVKFRNLESSNSNYIISKRDVTFTNYTHIYNSGNIHLYKNINYY